MVQNGKVKIYLADIRPLFDETMQKKALAQLDEVRRQKALSCRQTKQRAASLTAGLLAEKYPVVMSWYTVTAKAHILAII